MSEELVKKVARIIDGPGLTVDRAEAAIGVTLDAVRERMERLLDEGRDGAGYEAGLRAALESLGGEER